MIKIIVELWPHGFENLKKKIGEAIIANDGTGTLTSGNYYAKLFGKSNKPMKTGKVENFKRKKKHIWYLIYLVLKNIYEDNK